MRNKSRTRLAPTPTNISTNCEPEIEKNGTPASPETALANRVLPVPGDPTSGAPGTQGLGTLAQGFLELSNVKVVEEMVNLIMSQRAYEAGSKAVQAADEMLQVSNNIRR